MPSKLNALSNFQRLSENLNFMSLRVYQSNELYRQQTHHPKVCIEHVFINQMVARATVPLMQEVIHCAELINDDPVCEPLIKYMKKHIAEETDHDEWYVKDLAILGVSREEVFSRMPPPNIAAMVGSQYYWMRHHHPVAFMGYLLCFEVNHPTEEYVEDIIRNSGLPAAGFDTIMKHARIDVQHKLDIIDTINSLPLTEEHFKIIEMSAFQCMRYVALVMEDVVRVGLSNSNSSSSQKSINQSA